MATLPTAQVRTVFYPAGPSSCGKNTKHRSPQSGVSALGQPAASRAARSGSPVPGAPGGEPRREVGQPGPGAVVRDQPRQPQPAVALATPAPHPEVVEAADQLAERHRVLVAHPRLPGFRPAHMRGATAGPGTAVSASGGGAGHGTSSGG